MSEMAKNVLDNPNSAWNPDDIAQFRFEQFTALGFESELSMFLADSRMDVHAVQGWIRKGATALQAVRIEAGRDWQDDDPTFDHAGFNRLMDAAMIPTLPMTTDAEGESVYFDWLRD